MRNATRSLIAVGLSAAFLLPLTGSATALGPGGWDHLGQTTPTTSGLNAKVNVLSTDMPGKLIAGGTFTGAGQAAGNTVFDDGVAIWDGTSWSPLRADAGTPGEALMNANEVLSLEYDPGTGRIYAGGSFDDGPGGKPDNLAMWDTTNTGAGWQQLCDPGATGGGNVRALKIIGTTLYVGGDGQNWGSAGAASDGADELFKCDLTVAGGAIQEITPTDTETGGVRSLVTDSAGNLFAGGGFSDWDGVATADGVVRYVPPSNTVAGGTGGGITGSGPVTAMAVLGTDLYVGTDEFDVGGDPNSDQIARWNINSSDVLAGWSSVGQNTAGNNGYFAAAVMGTPDIQALTTVGSSVYASGHWQDANGEPLADKVQRFNASCTPVNGSETCWDTLGDNGAGDGPLTTGSTGAAGLAIFNGNLHVGGNFNNAGGDPLADVTACYSLGATPCTPIPAAPITPITPQQLTPVPTPPTPFVKCKRGQKVKNGKCVAAKKKKKKGK